MSGKEDKYAGKSGFDLEAYEQKGFPYSSDTGTGTTIIQVNLALIS